MIEGPFGNLNYHGLGFFSFGTKALPKKTKLALIVGGTGITPVLAIVQSSILANDGL